MKTVVIVEDEMLAAKRIQRLLLERDDDFEVLAILDSVKNTAKWIANNKSPDIIFMDIQLGDGLSFEVFDIVDVNCPVIFVTAFNQYAIEAFDLNSIAYLLKPISASDMEKAMAKYAEMTKMFSNTKLKQQVIELKSSLVEGFKKRFMIKVGDHIKSISTDTIAYFFSRDKATYIKTFDGKSYLLDYSLEYIDELLDPMTYYRINRKYLVNIDAISDITAYSNSRLALQLPHQEEKDVIVSREKVVDFKQWLDR